MIDKHNVTICRTNNQLHPVFRPDMASIVGWNVLSRRPELGVVDIVPCQFCVQLQELICVCTCHDAYEICQYILNGTLESQRVCHTVGYVKINHCHCCPSIPWPEDELPIRFTTERYQVLTRILRWECTAKEFFGSDMFMMQMRIWNNFLSFEIFENSDLCSFASLTHGHVLCRFPWRHSYTVDGIHPCRTRYKVLI